MSIQEIKSEIEALPAHDRKELVAFLVSLRHREIAGYRARMSSRIDDSDPSKWLTLEEMDQRLED